MIEPNNGQNQPRTKAEIVAQRERVRMLGIALGNWREAARQCGLSEGRVLNWVVRYGWKLPRRIEAPHPREMLLRDAHRSTAKLAETSIRVTIDFIDTKAHAAFKGVWG